METSSVARCSVSPSLCSTLLQHLRQQAATFRHINHEEEAPLRTLDHGLHGEGLGANAPPHPFMVRSGAGLWYHGYRFDQSLCEEQVHSTPRLTNLFGPPGGAGGAYFRKVLGYAAGSNAELKSTSPDLLAALEKELTLACLEVYPDCRVARLFSVYANLLLPGQSAPCTQMVAMHLDVPEFLGVERSGCPSWLLVAAHCSALFPGSRVRNVTAVCYPSSSTGGTLAVYHPQGGLCRVEAGSAVVLDTDSHFHHSGPTGPPGTPVPHLPDQCTLEAGEVEGSTVWRVKEGDKVVAEFGEVEVRISVSCKFHMFRSAEEAEEFYMTDGGDRLTAERIVERLVEDLGGRGVLPEEWNTRTPLHQLAPLLVQEYILPRAPRAAEVETMWAQEMDNI